MTGTAADSASLRLMVERAYKQSAVQTVLVAASLLLSLVSDTWMVVQAAQRGALLPGWQLPLYWLDYRNGPVRRGLPGELVSLVAGGSPSLGLVAALGLALSAAAILAIAYLSWSAAAHAQDPLRRVLALGVLLTTPLTVSLVLRDLVRFDDLGIVLMATACLPWRGWWTRPWASSALLSVGLAVASATTEFLLILLIPVAVVLLLRPIGWVRLAARGMLTLGPALGVLLVSFLRQPSSKTLNETLLRFRDAGGNVQGANAVSVLRDSLADQVHAVLSLQPRYLVGSVVVMAGFYVVTVCLLGWLLEWHEGRVPLVLVTYYFLVALSLGLLGIDFRRWWALAFLGLLASYVALRQGPDAVELRRPSGLELPTAAYHRTGHERESLSRPLASPVAVAQVLIIVVFLVGQRLPVFPKWDPSVTVPAVARALPRN